MSSIGHLALGVYGYGCEDALTHLMNYIWPNVFETSPHVVQAFMSAMEGMRLGLGPCKVLQYALQVSPLWNIISPDDVFWLTTECLNLVLPVLFLGDLPYNQK